MTERVLIADGSEPLRRALRTPLEAAGFTVSEAHDTRAAVERLRARPHEVALVDVELPGCPLELLDAVKTDPELVRTAVVLMSEDLADGVVLEGLDRGAGDCLRKPVEPVEAVIRVRAAVRLAQAQRKLWEGNARLTALAVRDDLTGLLTRRFLESHLRGLIAGATRHGRPLSVAMLDVDGFKHANDAHGHAVGDVVLRTVVERMASRLRQEDLLGRWGGDEFLVILPDVDLAGALTATDAVRRAIEETHVATDGEPIPVTLSGGVSTFRDGDTHASLVERADAALYAAKAAGRNRVLGEPVPVAR